MIYIKCEGLEPLTLIETHMERIRDYEKIADIRLRAITTASPTETCVSSSAVAYMHKLCGNGDKHLGH